MDRIDHASLRQTASQIQDYYRQTGQFPSSLEVLGKSTSRRDLSAPRASLAWFYFKTNAKSGGYILGIARPGSQELDTGLPIISNLAGFIAIYPDDWKYRELCALLR